MYKRHKGDDLLSNDKRLKYKWGWRRVASQISKEEIKRWTHFQSSECNVGHWTLEATQWGSEDDVYYEATIAYIGDHIDSIGGCHFGEDLKIRTRIDAQIRAEKLLKDWIISEYKTIVK